MTNSTYTAAKVMAEVKKAVIGKDDCVKLVMAAILAKGHILIEDIPGVGKTTLALAFSKSLGLHCQRVQFTPDVLPADIIGFSMYRKETGTFEYQPGAIMCNLFLADEINRTSPKTQSALLEVMEEGKVTVDKNTIGVPKPFVVIATENPMGSAGTQQLPESQLDRFLICMTIGYPRIEDEIEIVKGNQSKGSIDQVISVVTAAELERMQEEVGEIFVHDKVYDYIGKLVTETRVHPMLRMGMSPRGTIALTKMAKAYAFLEGREYCIPQDVKAMFPHVSGHRLCLDAKAKANHVKAADIIRNIMDKVPMPSPKREK